MDVAAFGALSVTIVSGRWSLTLSIALLRKALAALASRRAVRRKSTNWPFYCYDEIITFICAGMRRMNT